MPRVSRSGWVDAAGEAGEQRQALIREIARTGRGYLFFQDKLGGEISIGGTAKSPEMSFDATLVEILRAKDGTLQPGRHGLMEVQTMDFHGSYREAVAALNNALDLHAEGFPATLQQNLD